MNLLIDGLPETVEINGSVVPIDTSFRTGILFEELMMDESMDDLEKLQTALALYFPEGGYDIDHLTDAIKAMLWFYGCGDTASGQTGKAEATQDPAFSYEYDADYIYAAFLGSYGIDLARTTLHWWQFRALLRSLPEDTQFMKIIGYRSIDGGTLSKMTKEERKHYTKMKKLYALPKSEDRQQLESDLTQLLMNGGNPSDLL